VCTDNTGGVSDRDVPTGLLFTSVAARYDEFRPGYQDALFDDLAVLAELTPTSEVLEVGCGSGQATRGLLDRASRVLAIEPGPALADLARRRFTTERFALEEVRFEDCEPKELCDLVFSATAFHWVDPEVRWSKAALVLRPGGHLALVTHRTVGGATFDDLYEAARGLLATYAPEMDYEPAQPSAGSLIDAIRAESSDIGKAWFVAESKAGDTTAAEFFGEPQVRFYPWEHRYRASDAVGLLSTYSPYLALPPERSVPLLAGIEALIHDRFGGAVTRRYLTILALAERRGSPPGGTA